LCITLNPVSKSCPCPAKDIPVYSVFAPFPFKTLNGYSIDIFEPNEPVTQSICPPSSTIAFFVFRFNMFFDQFSIVEYLKYAFFLTYNSTQPACKFTLLYFGAEHPSIKCKLAPSSTIINVCSNCPDSGEFNLK